MAGRFFGVRFFLNIRITISFTKHLTVQLPITLIHPNSIDIPPNSLAQVAAAIEHKHRNRQPLTPDISYNYRPGQAFLAARRQSFDQAARKTISQEDITSIANALGNDPEKTTTQQARRRASTTHIASNSKSENLRSAYRNSRFLEGTNSFRKPPPSPQHPPPTIPPMTSNLPLSQGPDIPQRRTHRASLEEYSSRQASLDRQPSAAQHRRTRTSEDRHYRGPRLQRSTSGLKFSSSDDEDDGRGGGFGDTEVDTRTRLRRRMVSESQRPLRRDF
ncbi:MAG: hypothetical protein L6R42_007637 [Xanthoria sp. 1 TBL-2021]|nr:MAG: hypothetical protein L6R42_007637 [Xanthoria sp. 1 TBL-2021]